MSLVTTPISVGELLDKVTILEIKSEKISDKDKLNNINHELGLLNRICEEAGFMNAEVQVQKEALKTVNLKLWKIEDDIRIMEKNRQFDDAFIQLARSVYVRNDDRAAIKKKINVMTGSQLVEEKSYQDYS